MTTRNVDQEIKWLAEEGNLLTELGGLLEANAPIFQAFSQMAVKYERFAPSFAMAKGAVQNCECIHPSLTRSGMFSSFSSIAFCVGEKTGGLHRLLTMAGKILKEAAGRMGDDQVESLHDVETVGDLWMLAHMIDEAGIPLADAANIIAVHGTDSNRKGFSLIAKSIREGQSLSVAVRATKDLIVLPKGNGFFSDTHFVGILETGENVGETETALKFIAAALMDELLGIEIFPGVEQPTAPADDNVDDGT